MDSKSRKNQLSLQDNLRSSLKNGKEPFPEILGQEKAKKQIVSAILASRHIVIQGYPGVGKTTLAKSISALLPEVSSVEGCEFNCDPSAPACPSCISRKSKGEKLKEKSSNGESRFIRVQGSPDLQAEDLLGDIDPIKALEFGPRDERAFTPGKILRAHRGILFFDEINRCPERLQNALLQVLEEGNATIGGHLVDYPTDFILIGTMNPKESSGTEKLSDALLDRFDIVEMGYPENPETEAKIVRLKAAETGADVPEGILAAIVAIVRRTRADERIERPAGVRASIGLYERTAASAVINSRSKAEISDVLDSLHSVLDHRIKLAPKFRHSTDPVSVIDSIAKEAIKDAKK